ncbi:MAG: CocE/NonD family hydrolase [Acidobacteriia bacterium]|nr:CocE/NonD family hydrolase [Terriglobia bacterium]
MSIGSRILARLWHLPAPYTRDIVEHQDIRVSMSDGVELLSDRYYPRSGECLPVILIRSPYGRGDQFRDLALIFAERGFQVLLQSCRGTGGSGGLLRPSFQEEQDGATTIDWLNRQPWYCGRLALLGTSYLGNAAWAAVHAVGPQIAAMALHATLSDASAETYAFEGFTLEGCLIWTLQLTQPQFSGTVRSLLRSWLSQRHEPRSRLPALDSLPLRDVDNCALGRHVSWWQDWVNHAELGDPFWKPLNFSAGVTAAPPTAMIGGWHDIFLPWQIKDYAAMQAAGRSASLTIGPWVHAALAAWGEGVRQALPLFRTQLLDQPAPPRAPVRLYVIGAEEWRDYDSWPPPGTRPAAFYLCAGGGLSPKPPDPSEPDRYTYDPADPTPAVHGPRLGGVRPTGDMAQLESRSDVLLFTAEPLAASLEVIGPVSAELFFRSSLEHTDFFLVLCDVSPNRRCTNVCDGYIRIRPHRPSPLNDGVRHVHIEFWPTAYCFRQGHRMRIIVASGAHPRYARNLGSSEPLADAVTFHVAHQQIFHDPHHPSQILLPIGVTDVNDA